MIEVVAVAGLVTVQDGGRPGRLHEGVPPGGALVPELLARANAGARNAAGDAGLEVFGSVRLVARGPVLVATDAGDDARLLSPGDELTVTCAGARVRYVALRGGADVPLVLGGRGTLLAAGFGGLEGRALRRGDRVAAGRAVERGQAPPPRPDLATALRAVPGPDLERFGPGALEVLAGGAWEVSARSDRTGVRLRGPAILRAGDDAAVSAPMVRGAVQVPASGEPIVLGPDHPTTGGYPVVATVVTADVGALMARPAGAIVRFVVVAARPARPSEAKGSG